MKSARDSRAYRAQLRLLTWLGAWFMRLLGSTWRIQGGGPDPFATGTPWVGATWHRGMLVAAYLWRGRGVAVPVSLSRDGDLIAAVLHRLGFAESPRGSSSRGGAALLRSSIRCVRMGGSVGVLPDGPRGPARAAKPGVVALARSTGASLVPVGLAARPCLHFGSWDRAILPLPFARVRFLYGSPVQVPMSARGAELETVRVELEMALDALDQELEAELAGSAAAPDPAEGPAPRDRSRIR